MKSSIIAGFVFTAFLGFSLGQDAFGVSLGDLITPEQAAALTAGEKTSLAQFTEPRPQLVPRNSVVRELVEAVRQDLGPSVMVETLHLYKKPPEAETAAWSEDERAALYNGALALSTLAGIQYFSQSRGIMRTLYETSAISDSPAAKNLLPDPVYPRPPAELTVYARQKDTTFGDNVYQYDYYAAPGALIFTQQNLTALTYGIIPAVGKNKLHSVVAVLDAGEYLLIYAVSMAKAASVPGMNSRIGDSFANRADAVVHWFSDQADKAFKKVHP